MKYLFLAGFALSTCIASAQKTTVRNGMILTGDVPHALIIRDGCRLETKCNISLHAPDGKTLVLINYSPVSYGGHTYAIMHFVKLNVDAKVEDLSSKENKLAKFIVKESFIKNGAVDEDVALAYVQMHPL